MRIWKQTLLLLGLATRLTAQTELEDPAFLARLNVVFPASGSVSNFWVTNYGSPIFFIYGDDVTNTMAGSSNAVSSWTDRSVNGWTLTNANQWSKAPLAQTNTLNGHTTVNWDGVDDFLRNLAFTNSYQYELEMWMVMKWSGVTNGTEQVIFENGPGSRWMLFEKNASDKLLLFEGSSVTGGSEMSSMTNKWFVWTLVFSGTNPNAAILTNNVIYASGKTGNTNISGITFGSHRNVGGNFAPISIAEMCIYSATNAGTVRTAIYQGLTNKYGNANF